MCRPAGALLFATLALFAPGAGAQQQTGTLAGRVTAQGTNEPVAEATVSVVGTSLVATTNAEGRYTLRNVPTGSHAVRALRVGFLELKRPVTVTAGEAATLDFVLAPAVVRLQEVVTTATGPQRRVELGNAVAHVQVADIMQTQPIKNMGDLLVGRAPGVQVLPGNVTGGGAKVRIRGTGSLSLANDPIYIIDGIRMTSNAGSTAIGIGGTTPSRVNDLNPDEIENIEIVKGPSAATLYGTDAANGVVVITTKKGRAGAPRWNVYAETGAIRDYNPYPSSYTLFGHAPATPTTTRTCVLTEVSAGTCVPDSLKSLNVTKEDDLTPLGTGFRQQYGAQLSGGTDAVRFFTGVEWEDEVGVFRMDDVSRRRYLTNGLPLREEWARPNALTRTSLRANVNAAVSPKLDLQVSTNYINSAQRLPQIDNNINGLFFSALGGPGYRTGTGSLGEPLNGYGIFTPYDMFQYTTTQGINRFIGGGNLSWRPLTWMSNRANVGIDYAARTDQQLCRRNNCPDFGSNRLGFALDYRTNIRNFSVDLGSTATFNPLSWMESRTTVGAQYVNYRFDRNGASGSTLPPGTQTVTAGAVPFADQAHVLSKTLGLFAEEQLAMRDRLFVTLAVRTDQNSAFGTDFQRVVYPKASVSWILSQERFFPQFTWLDQFRVRAAYGAAGQQPGPNDALRFFQPNTSNIAGVDQPVVQFQALGNQELKPERATEVEAGFDARFRNRLSLELTYYSKVTKDALIATIIPPTVGAGATTRFDNLGSVRNAGAEGLINAQIIDRPAIGWDLTLSGSTNANKLVSLGNVPPQIGAIISQKKGYPLNAYWHRPIKSFNDANDDGIITANEIVVGDTAEFRGYSTPRHEVVVTNGVEVLRRRLRLTVLADYKGGHKLYDNTNRIRCASRNNCRELLDRSAPLEQQAAVVALREHASRSQDGYIKDATFFRLREVSATASLPDGFVRRYLRGRSASINFAARNLWRWTKYTGVDPEANYVTDADTPSDLVTPAPPTYVTLRLNLGF